MRRASRALVVASVVACGAMAATGSTSARIAVLVPVLVVLALGLRRGFATRGAQARHAPLWLTVWAVGIVLLLAFELRQVMTGATTATQLMVPVLAVPLVRAIAIAVWLRLGWTLVS